ncbi:hypothetical protein V6N11_028153 [Hibiscus sabdariffa]|uniref:Uncharacterized protein n=2 Tax=Hibiscus sabdariffa TaxID=183260 RepID=A0ABR2BPE5_9ROSI
MVDLNAPLVPCVGIDGFVQKLEYKGLQHICYGCGVYKHAKDSCPKTNPKRASKGVVNGSSSSSNAISTTSKEPEELFGPWMTVDNHRRHSGNKMMGDRNKSLTIAMAEGSRFAALESDVTEIIPIVVADTMAPSPTKVLADAAYLASIPPRKSKASSSVDTQSKVLPMVLGQPIVLVKHHPSKSNVDHRAVTLLEHEHGKEVSGVDGLGKNRGFKVRNAKENSKPRLLICKPSPAKIISRLVLSDWVDNVQAQLNFIVMHKELKPAGTSKVVINHDGLLEVQPSIPVMHREDGVTVVPSLVNDGREVVSD